MLGLLRTAPLGGGAADWRTVAEMIFHGDAGTVTLIL